MSRRIRYLLMGGGLALMVLAMAACAGDTGDTGARGDTGAKGDTGATGGFASTPADKLFYVTAFEVKGATDGIDPPSTNPKDLSDGYGFKGPGVYDSSNPNKWQVASYMWTPGAMTVMEGDRVELNIFVLNGDEHDVWVEAPDGTEVVREFTMNRGREYVKSFTASQAGVYRLICNTHEPTMTATILVLPTS